MMQVTPIWIKNAIDNVLLRNNIIILPQLVKQLKKEGIDTVLRQNTKGLVYGVTFVDHETKSVFNGSGIGKEYSANRLQDKCAINITGEPRENQMVKSHTAESLMDIMEEYKSSFSIADIGKILDALTKVEYTSDYLPRQFKSKQRKGNRRKKL